MQTSEKQAEHPIVRFRKRNKRPNGRPMTQTEAGALIGCSWVSISRYENGQLPSRTVWGDIEEKMGIKPEELIKASRALKEKQ